MATIRESKVWARLNNYLKLHKPGKYWIFQRIETGSTVRGFPDVVFLEGGCAIFLELKEVKGNQIQLSWEQVNMLTFLANCGFRVWVVAHKVFPTHEAYYLGHGRYAEDIKENGIKSQYVHEFDIIDKLSLYEMFVVMGILNPIQVEE